jgi:hypothetical protein
VQLSPKNGEEHSYGVTKARGMRPVPEATLVRWRALDAADVLIALADHAKRDPTFIPVKESSSSRWHARVGNVEFELVLTGPKFWDSGANVGGGGALDLVLHLVGGDFRKAVARLRAAKL